MTERSLYRLPLALALLLALSLAACAPAAPADGRLGVVVSIAPQRYFAERIGGEHVRVSVHGRSGR